MSPRPSLAVISNPEVEAAERTVMIPNCWYPIVDLHKIKPSRPLGLERFNKRWVLWKKASGEVACLPAACPHRGVDRSLGAVHNGQLVCPYHGFQFDSEGTCTRVPCQNHEARIPKRLHQTGPALREAHGLVWMWYGPQEPQGEPLWLPEAPEPGPRVATWEEDWNVSFTRVMEGLQDMHHFPFAHRKIDPWRGRVTVLHPYKFRAEGGDLAPTMRPLPRRPYAPGHRV